MLHTPAIGLIVLAGRFREVLLHDLIGVVCNRKADRKSELELWMFGLLSHLSQPNCELLSLILISSNVHLQNSI